MNRKVITFITSFFLLSSAKTMASSYDLPDTDNALIGKLTHTTIHADTKTVDIAKQYDVGFNALQNANPQLKLTPSISTGTTLKIPTEHLIPDLPRKGIIVNLPEMRMYYFPAGSHTVLTYPIGIGKIGRTIPIAFTTVTNKKVNPNWIAPEDIREFDLQTQGLVVPQVVPPGPDNPLGPYAIYMGIPTYLIHSTIFPESIGKRASFGCIRMYPSDIENFFPTVTRGIPVAIINSPVKVAWQGSHVYLEAYAPMEEHKSNADAHLPGIVHLIQANLKSQPVLVNWQLVSYIAEEQDGTPHDIGMKITH